jgi:hypothetical protein
MRLSTAFRVSKANADNPAAIGAGDHETFWRNLLDKQRFHVDCRILTALSISIIRLLDIATAGPRREGSALRVAANKFQLANSFSPLRFGLRATALLWGATFSVSYAPASLTQYYVRCRIFGGSPMAGAAADMRPLAIAAELHGAAGTPAGSRARCSSASTPLRLY